MKCVIDREEWYPVFDVRDDKEGLLVLVPDELYERHRLVKEQFLAVQSELCDLYYKAKIFRTSTQKGD